MTKFHCVDVTTNVSRRDDNETHCDVSKLLDRHHFSHRYVKLMDGIHGIQRNDEVSHRFTQ